MPRIPVCPRVTPFMRLVFATALIPLLLVPGFAFAQANGKLQIFHVDVGQGDGALLISPQGQMAFFDDGTYTDCSGIKNFCSSHGITSVQYHFLSHYHADHLGCIDDLAAAGVTIAIAGYDRGYSYSSGTYTTYVNTLGAKRVTIAKGQTITLDAGAANPVSIQCVDLNGAGVYSPSGSDENAKSAVYLVTYGNFNEVIGGDLTGDPASGNDVETTVGPEVGDVEVYKVHHHGSRYSSNDNWLNAVTAEVAVISCGNGNSYGHPTAEALGRLHAHNVHTYWTETGAGVAPLAGWDKVGGTISIQADPAPGAAYTVSGTGFTDTYYNDGGVPPIHTIEFPTALTMLKGSLATGDVTRLAVSDDSRIGVSAGVTGGQYYTDWYGSVVLQHPPLDLTVTYEGSFTVNRTQTLYLWNWTTSAWDQENSATVGTTDVTKTFTASVASYVSATREVRFRVKGNNRNGSSYTSRGDYMAFAYDYTSGTAPMMAARHETPVANDAAAAAGGSADAGVTAGPERDPEALALSASPNPAYGTTGFAFTMPRAADVRLDVYDLQGRRLATPMLGRAAAGPVHVDWALRDDAGHALAPGLYFARLQTLGRTLYTRVTVLRH